MTLYAHTAPASEVVTITKKCGQGTPQTSRCRGAGANVFCYQSLRVAQSIVSSLLGDRGLPGLRQLVQRSKSCKWRPRSCKSRPEHLQVIDSWRCAVRGRDPSGRRGTAGSDSEVGARHALALVPLALSSGQPGSAIQSPMAVVILWGLLSSTLLNMLVVPAMLLQFSAERESQTGSVEAGLTPVGVRNGRRSARIAT